MSAPDVQEITSVFRQAVFALTRHFVMVDGTIEAVDWDKFTCTVGIEGAEFFNVPVKVLISSQASVIEKPEVGSDCILGFRDGNLQRPQLIWVDKSTDFLIDSPQVTVHGGKLGGVPKVIELTQKLNNLENLVNNLITLYNTHVHPVTAVGSPTGVTSELETGSLTPTEQKEIEDETFTH